MEMGRKEQKETVRKILRLAYKEFEKNPSASNYSYLEKVMAAYQKIDKNPESLN